MVKDEGEQSGHAMSGYGFFKVCVKFITPLCMILILYSIPQTEVPEFVRFVRTFVLSVVL